MLYEVITGCPVVRRSATMEFIGYFDSLKANSYTLDVIAPSDFMGTSALEKVNTVFTDDNKMVTSYVAPRYFDITDNPMMYGYLDVEEFKVDDINVVLSVYSPNKVHQAKTIKETVYKMMEAQKAYLGDIHTTDRYDIILFLSDGKKDSPTRITSYNVCYTKLLRREP